MENNVVVVGVVSAGVAIWLYHFAGSRIAKLIETFDNFASYIKADAERIDKLNVVLGMIAEECANTRKAAEIVRDTVTNAVAGSVPGTDPQVQRYLAMVEGWRQQGIDQGQAEKLAADAFLQEIEGQF